MDWVVTIVGLIGFHLAGKKIRWAWYVNIANQVLWVIFAVISQQWGFLVGAGFYLAVFIKNAVSWTKEHRQKQRIVEGLRKSVAATVLTPNETRQIILKRNGL